ncbi:uncharacterized protein LOC143851638 [Tasmannia lanceolata]|uniref:uncharacterized protein LOC143851638 n=1 Tax=Tasmannia lanceolata TaxID=3420 RepID=UPI004062E4DA
MAKEMKPSFMAMGILGILREAFKIPFRNGKLALFLALLLLIPSYFLFLTNNFTVQPLTSKLTMKFLLLPKDVPGSPEYTELLAEIMRDVRILVGEVTFFLIISKVVSIFSTVVTVYASAVIYAGNHLTISELFSRVRGTWKRPVITWLYVNLFSLGYLLILGVLIGFLLVIGKGGSVALIALGVILLLSALLCFFYLGVVWDLGVVVSVVEEGCYGLEALFKAGGLIKGRRLQGFVLFLISTLVPIVISQIFAIKETDVNNTKATQIVMGLVLVNITGLVSLYNHVVCTVFYYECKKSHGEEVEVQGVMGYSMVPATPQLKADNP